MTSGVVPGVGASQRRRQAIGTGRSAAGVASAGRARSRRSSVTWTNYGAAAATEKWVPGRWWIPPTGGSTLPAAVDEDAGPTSADRSSDQPDTGVSRRRFALICPGLPRATTRRNGDRLATKHKLERLHVVNYPPMPVVPRRPRRFRFYPSPRSIHATRQTGTDAFVVAFLSLRSAHLPSRLRRLRTTAGRRQRCAGVSRTPTAANDRWSLAWPEQVHLPDDLASLTVQCRDVTTRR